MAECGAVIYIRADDPYCTAELSCDRKPHKTGMHRHASNPHEVQDLDGKTEYAVVYWRAEGPSPSRSSAP